MEKRTLLAFALSFLILLVWSFLFGPSPERAKKTETGKEVTEKAKEAQVQEPARVPSPEPVSSPPEASGPTPLVEAREVVVDTPLYRAVLSSTGPGIRSFLLKRYRQSVEPHSPPVQLVSLDKGKGDFLEVGFWPVKGAGGKQPYRVEGGDITLRQGGEPADLIFWADGPGGVRTIKTFRFYPDQYHIDLRVEVENRGTEPAEGRFGAHLMAHPAVKKSSYYSYVGLAMLLDGSRKELDPEGPSEPERLQGRLGWLAYQENYFISAVLPQEETTAEILAERGSSGVLEGDYRSEPVSVAPGARLASRMRLYLGPLDVGILKAEVPRLAGAVDFGWTDIIAKPLLYVLRFFHRYLHNYGLAIILLTVLVKILFWPLTHKSYKSMKELKKLQPRLAKIREKYKHDRQKMNQEMMALYRTYKVNPMGGCLPMIVQIPVFFALYRVLGSAIELRHAPFVLWINDLSAPDRLFHFSFQIPFMSPPSGIPVLTLLMGASMFIQQKMTPTPGDPSQAKMMMFLPIIFTFMFINFPSGLVLYWLVNNVLSIGQQYRINKRPA